MTHNDEVSCTQSDGRRTIRFLPFTTFGATVSAVTICYAIMLAVLGNDFAMLVLGDAKYVDLPLSYDFAMLAFAILNLPAVALAWPVLTKVIELETLSRGARVALYLGVQAVTSCAWWYLVYRLEDRRRRSRSAAT